MNNLKTLCLLGLLILQQSCSSFPTPRLSRSDITDMEGIWFSKGYGYLIDLQREHLDLYNVAGDSCYKEDYSTQELAYDFPLYRRISSSQMELGEREDDKTIQFVALTSLPVVCKTPTGSNPISVANAFGDILEEHYPFFKLHNIDWAQRRLELMRQVNPETTDEQLAESLFSALEGISDSHLGVLARINGNGKGQSRRQLRTLDKILKPIYAAESPNVSYNRFRRNWIAEQRASVSSVLLGSEKRSLADDKLAWGTIGNIGYLQVTQFLDYGASESEKSQLKQFAEHIDTILNGLAGTDALVIDVSLSRGGYGSLGFELASRFVPQSITDNNTLLVHKHYKYNSGFSDIREEYLQPSANVTYDKPVFVVSSEATTSAAEEFLMAMRIQRQVTLLGMPSNGSLSDVLEKSLPNGWLMVLSHEVYLSPEDELFEKQGVPVDIEVDFFRQPDAAKSYSTAMLQILDIVQSRVE